MSALTSHELARQLLARRDNDLRFLLIVDDGEDQPYRGFTIGPFDPDGPDGLGEIFGRETVGYDPLRDAVTVRVGVYYDGPAEEEDE